MFQELIELSNYGWRLLPLYSVTEDGACSCPAGSFCKSAGKHPFSTGGQRDATLDPEKIEVWSNLTNNFGVNCRESDLIVVDIDPRNGGIESFARLVKEIPEFGEATVTSLTGNQHSEAGYQRGLHLYYFLRSSDDGRFNLGSSYPGIDIKRNGYVVVPGSAHPSGVRYEWVQERSPSEIEIRPFPLVSSPKVDLADSNTSIPQQKTSRKGKLLLQQEHERVSSAQEGARNETLFASGIRIGHLVREGEVNPMEALENLLEAGVQSGLDKPEVVRTLVRPTQNGALQLGAGDGFQGNHFQGQSEESDIGKLLNLVDWDKAFNAPEEIDWLVPSFLAKGRGHGLYSAPGLGKSLLCLEIAASLSSGKPAMGHSYHEPIRVLYLDQENNVESDIVPRLRSMGFSPEQLQNFVYSSFPELWSMDSAKGGRQLEQALETYKPDLVFFDTVARFVEGQENDNSTWNDFYNYAGVAMKRRGIAYLRLDHVGKDESKGPRGGSAKMGDVDLVWKLAPAPGETDSMLLKNEKSRIPIEHSSFTVRRETEGLLKHTVKAFEGSAINFSTLLKLSEKYTRAVELLDSMVEREGKLAGQKSSWELMKLQAKAEGITHDTFTEAHRQVSANLRERQGRQR